MITGRTSGVTDHYANNDEHALQIARNIVETLNLSKEPNVIIKILWVLYLQIIHQFVIYL